MSVTDRDRGASYLIRRAAQLANRVQIGVGVPADAGEYPDGTPVAVVAAAHEFGLGNVPQRSFIRGWYDSKGSSTISRDLAKTAQDVILHGTSLEGAMNALGERYVKEVRERMDAHIAPALQPETVARKTAEGSSTPETPLENTHQLRDAIIHVVKT